MKTVETANFEGAILAKVNLSGADLSNLNFSGANLTKANLSGADLSGANLTNANLTNADFTNADLSNADLTNADLSIFAPYNSRFSGADLSGADLSGADLSGSNLSKTTLRGGEEELLTANFEGAVLAKVDFSDSGLSNFNLSGADLSGANLSGADLSNTNLSNSTLVKTNLRDALLPYANLEGAIFEIELNNLPDVVSIAKANNLSLLKYNSFSHALVELRKEFSKFGLRKQERELIYAIKHSAYLNAMSDGDVPTKIQWIIGRILFEFTCLWGMSPWRPLLLLFVFMFLFSICYIFSLKQKMKQDGIWRVWIKERLRQDLGAKEPELLRCRWMDAICYGFYFSILSAFHIGWRDINMGAWISKMQKKEYRFEATGWVRLISGIQSLLSLYFFALWVSIIL